MVLSDKLIKAFGGEIFSPFSEDKVQPASYDLSIKDSVTIRPADSLILATTLERVKMPKWLTGEVKGKSSLRRLGLSVCSDAGWIDPGFEGEITLELKNDGKKPIHLSAGQDVAQLVLLETAGTVEEGYDGHYQHQTGATKSHLEKVTNC